MSQSIRLCCSQILCRISSVIRCSRSLRLFHKNCSLAFIEASLFLLIFSGSSSTNNIPPLRIRFDVSLGGCSSGLNSMTTPFFITSALRNLHTVSRLVSFCVFLLLTNTACIDGIVTNRSDI
uniref:Uncharacterized protein n=1 Tax=Parascaris univalens TaxID=6257 RepID=A0A915CFC7_PARUN